MHGNKTQIPNFRGDYHLIAKFVLLQLISIYMLERERERTLASWMIKVRKIASDERLMHWLNSLKAASLCSKVDNCGFETESTSYSIELWEQICHSVCSSSCSVSQNRLLPNEMSDLPGSSLTTHQALDAVATRMMQMSGVVQIFHSFDSASVWLTTRKLGLLNMELVHTLHATTPLTLLVTSIFSCRVMCPHLISSCVGHKIEKVNCVESVKMAMALHYTHTLWNAVSAGDMVMDGSCTISWNSFQ